MPRSCRLLVKTATSLIPSRFSTNFSFAFSLLRFMTSSLVSSLLVFPGRALSYEYFISPFSSTKTFVTHFSSVTLYKVSKKPLSLTNYFTLTVSLKVVTKSHVICFSKIVIANLTDRQLSCLCG